MKKTATITFHASHNYGSMLQAYALQYTLYKLGYENDIINLRTDRQKLLYSRISYRDVFINVRKAVKTVLTMPYINALQNKFDLFEEFLTNSLKLTKEYHSLEEIKNEELVYDCFISGSDQIWNTSAFDFDWSFFLPFVRSGKRISYAASLGPKITDQLSNREQILNYLQCYDHLSVRDEVTAYFVRELLDRNVNIDLDPTFLLTQEEWKEKYSRIPLIDGNYILLYAPFPVYPIYDIALYFSRKLKLPVVVTLFSWRDLKYPFKKFLKVGPWEFLNLIEHARLVLSGSFHALVFASIFRVPFFAVNGDKDNRMCSFLKNIKMFDRTINDFDYKLKCTRSWECDFLDSDYYILDKRKDSLSHLVKMINE